MFTDSLRLPGILSSVEEAAVELKEKVLRREIRNWRKAIRVVGANGQDLVRDSDIRKRVTDLRNGCDRRRGEKIVGEPGHWQTGVHLDFGGFLYRQQNLTRFRNILNSTDRHAAKPYFEHEIAEILRSARRDTLRLIWEIKNDFKTGH